jgi:hypothetical protein
MTARCQPSTSGAPVPVVVSFGSSLLLGLLIIGVGAVMPTVSG